MAFSPDKLLSILRGLPAAQRYWVGFSGGLDSTVLLRALAELRGALPGELQAVHVNHHLQKDAERWRNHCLEVCAELQVHCEIRDVEVHPGKGESLEAVARARRYAAYRELLRRGELLLLAQHQDDQLETFLLQTLRGAGLRGLAAMPRLAPFGSGQVARPLLAFTRSELAAWAEACRFDWQEDPSNADTAYRRNYLRQRVIPLLRARWPAAAATVSRSAQHCAEAMNLLSELAAEDLLRCGAHDNVLESEPLLALGQARGKNVLRCWLQGLQLPVPSACKLAEIFTEVAPARADRNPCVTWPGAQVRRYRGRLHALAPQPDIAGAGLRLHPALELGLGATWGSLSLQAATGEGVGTAHCPAEGFTVRFRSGGEICRPVGRAHRRPLKKWLQEYAVLPWMRARLPLIYADNDLAAVAGLFVCAPFAAARGQPGLRIVWRSPPRLRD